MAAPRFSILLPTHNRAEVAGYAIRSVLGQTVTDFELLVVGDGCTDDTAQVVQGFRDSRVQWFDLPKAPHFGYANRNIVLRQACGELVAYMAHDDLWLPDHLELLAECLDGWNADLAYSRTLFIEPDGLIMPSAFNLHDPAIREAFTTGRQNHLVMGSVIHRRDCLARFGYWNETLPSAGDWDLWVRIVEGGGGRNFAFLPLPTNLHFRANWRRDTTIWNDEFRAWHALRADGGALPDALQLTLGPGELEQVAAWRALSADPAGWTRRLRAAVQQALDKRIHERDEAWAELARENDTLRSNLRAVQSSLGWQISRRARAFRDRLLPPGSRGERGWLALIRLLRRAILG